jgi:hypothetical protein
MIVAAGSQSSYYGNDAWQEWALGLKSLEEATNIRHKILYAFEVAERIPDSARRRAWLTFLIVGAGPTGVESRGSYWRDRAADTQKRLSIHTPGRGADHFARRRIASSYVLPGRPGAEGRALPGKAAGASKNRRHGQERRSRGRDHCSWQQHQPPDHKNRHMGWGVTVTPLARTLAKRTGAETDREEGSRSAPTSQSPIIRISVSSEIWHSL